MLHISEITCQRDLPKEKIVKASNVVKGQNAKDTEIRFIHLTDAASSKKNLNLTNATLHLPRKLEQKALKKQMVHYMRIGIQPPLQEMWWRKNIL